MSERGGENPNLGEMAYRRIRHRIVTCALQPGSRVSERGLADDLGFGLAPVRAALARLDQDGLVTATARRGYTVKAVTVKSVDDLFELWNVLAPMIVRLGLTNATQSEREYIADLLDTTNRSDLTPPASDSSPRNSDGIIDLFDLLSRFTGNDYIVAAYRQLSADLLRLRNIVSQHGLLRAEEPENFDRIARLYREGDVDAAAVATREVGERLRVNVNSVMRQLPLSAPGPGPTDRSR